MKLLGENNMNVEHPDYSDLYWTLGLPDRVHSNRPLVRSSLDSSLVFSEIFMKLGVNKLKKVTQPELEKKILIQGLSIKN